ncbi:MAG: methionine adenosyltransferase [Planctomycetota bacterium]
MGDSYLFTSESVTEGHPDKMADAISDAILDAMIAGDPKSRVAVETLVTRGMALVAGEVTTETYVPISDVIRETVKGIGYTKAEYGFDYEDCSVLVSIGQQSPDIAMGVDESADHEQGAGDQGIMFGYASNETPELMPAPIMYAHKLCQKLAELRKSGDVVWLRPDGKSQVTVEYADGKIARIPAVVISTQHDGDVDHKTIKKTMIEKCIKAVIPNEYLDDKTLYHVNPTGRFEIGGPAGDTGLTGRKIIVDTYGGMGRHGGGAFSGKDPSKVDRSAAYMGRHIAKTVVAAGLADRCEIEVGYAIGVAQPVGVMVETFGTAKVEPQKIEKAILDTFPLKPKQIIAYLDLLRPIFKKTAAYGHFGRELPEFTWEGTDKAEDLKKACGA